MSKPLRKYFEESYDVFGRPPMLAMAKMDYAVTSFAATLGIQETADLPDDLGLGEP